MIAPTLETERLILRAQSLDDFEATAEFYASDRSILVGGPISRYEAWGRFVGYAGLWALRGYGMWTVVLKSSGGPVGRVGLHHPDSWPEPELGWFMFASGEGHGYAKEAATTARTYWYDTLGNTTLISTIAANNPRSIALAHRLGATYENDWDSPYGPIGIYRHPAPEALQ